MTFADLGINEVSVAALATEGITYPFPIQLEAIPIAMKGTDLIAQARTGTGKTLAFGLPILERITPGSADGRPQALIMCPTRELALQVAGDLETASGSLGVRILTVYGGVGYEPQLDQLSEGVDIVVGTPGRLLDLVNRKSLKLNAVGVLVLDEADEMLDLGFLPDVEKLISFTPSARQTMLFSATMPAAIVSLARAHLTQPINIRAEVQDASTTVPQTTQFVYQAHDLDKPAIVGKLLQTPGVDRVMVFCTTKRDVSRLAEDLTDRGFKVTSIHGDLSQAVRERSLAKFKAGKAQVIVCTDVAARGIDVDNVTHVVNYDCPDDEKTYVHRIGRTGRAGRTGIAVTFVDWSDIPRWRVINRALDLGFNDPLEAYSTTPQLLEELGIPQGATGRITPERTPAEREAAQQSRRSGDKKSRPRKDFKSESTPSVRSDSPRKKTESSSRRDPGRRQRRSQGVVIREKAETQTSASQPEPTTAKPRRRRRNIQASKTN